MMKRTIAILATSLFLTTAHAQTFLDHLQNDDKSSGQVSVKQSEDINKLVNGSGKSKEQDTKQEATRQEERSRQESRSSENRQRDYERNVSTAEDEARDKARRERERKAREAARAKKMQEFEENVDASSSRKKLMSNSKRAKGYRIQVFAGGNTRLDRAKAQEMGAKVKTKFPGHPVYVHFYSPRWCCRFGNFRNQEAATKLLKQVKKEGFKNACVIKTAITVNR
ncbi:MAG: SPOR domain-containing protein [Prevotella sp.]|nr:SPOR domain-containing protein [Prevotella sp.]